LNCHDQCFHIAPGCDIEVLVEHQR
jgi:hypothetical protein